MNFWKLYEEMQKTRICVFDFDDTLVNTPDRQQGSDRYQQATGNPWPHTGWYGRKETLTPPVFTNEPENLNQNIANEFHKAKSDPHTTVVLLTGRHNGLKKQVQAILNHYGLKPDEEYYQQGFKNTWDFKEHVILKLANRPNVQIIELWDDRNDHLPNWLSLCQQIKNNSPEMQIIFHHVNGQDYNI